MAATMRVVSRDPLQASPDPRRLELVSVRDHPSGYATILRERVPAPWADRVAHRELFLREIMEPADFRRITTTLRGLHSGTSILCREAGAQIAVVPGSEESEHGWRLESTQMSFDDMVTLRHVLGLQLLASNLVIVCSQGIVGSRQSRIDFERRLGIAPNLFGVLLAGHMARLMGANLLIGTAQVLPHWPKSINAYEDLWRKAGIEWMGGRTYGLRIAGNGPIFPATTTARLQTPIDFWRLAVQLV